MVLLVEEISKVKILRCPETGIAVYETHEDKNGYFHREGAPATIERDRDTGSSIRLMYYFRDLSHRSGGKPAVQSFSHETKAPIWRAWREHGEYFRAGDLPHVEVLDAQTGHVIRAEYRLRNDTKKGYYLHREKGPAVITFNKDTGEQTGAVFYRFGRKQNIPNAPTMAPGMP